MKSVILTLIITVFFLFNISNANTVTNEVTKAKEALKDTISAQKYIYRSSKKSKKQIQDGIKKIETECCELNFNQVDEINKIKSNLEKCLNDECHKYNMGFFNRKKPPLKLIVLRELELIDDILMANEKQKYDNLITEQKDQQRSVLLENEKDIEVFKNNLKDSENENLKLKKTVNKMLIKYQKKISELEKKNLILEENFSLVFEAHSKTKQKKLKEELK